ncbi:hypothetical protein ACRRTK_016213 [Alexandromys fortis]
MTSCSLTLEPESHGVGLGYAVRPASRNQRATGDGLVGKGSCHTSLTSLPTGLEPT